MALTYSCDAPAQPIRKQILVSFIKNPKQKLRGVALKPRTQQKRLLQGGATGNRQRRPACLQII